jgi:hypothetical protein
MNYLYAAALVYVFAATSAYCESARIGDAGDWVAFKEVDPFDGVATCAIVSVTEPRITIFPTLPSAGVEYPPLLAQLITKRARALAAVNTGTVEGVTRAAKMEFSVLYKFRIGEGEIFEAVDGLVDKGCFKCKEIGIYKLDRQRFIAALRDATSVLHMRWELGPEQQTFSYRMGEFPKLWKDSVEACAKPQ